MPSDSGKSLESLCVANTVPLRAGQSYKAGKLQFAEGSWADERDVLEQSSLTSICGTSDVMKVLVTRSITWQQLHAAACVFHRAAAAAVKIFYDYFIAGTRFESTSEYDNTEIVFFTAVLPLSISFNL